MDLTQTPLPLPAKEPGWVNRIQSDPHVLGDIADIVVLDADPSAVSAAQLRDLPVAATLLGGRFTHRAL